MNTNEDKDALYIVEAMVWDTDYSFAAAVDDYARAARAHRIAPNQADAYLRGYIANRYPNRAAALLAQ